MPGIFLVQNDGSLVEMTEQPYDTEDVLQGLLAQYPRLLSGDSSDAGGVSRWLLIRREMPVPSEQDGSDRWSLDHLFIDQDAIPTLIEVKRSSDTRIRREVVGQLLDYAANAVVYWPVEEFQSHFARECEASGIDPASKLQEFLGPSRTPEEFWQLAKTNLQAGRIRMVFVADAIPPELRRIVEFLNGQMDPAEVLAVEIKQFVGEGMKTLVPKIIGQTAEAEKKKSVSRGDVRQWDEPSFFAELERVQPPQIIEAFRSLYAKLTEKATALKFEKGKIYATAFPSFGDNRGRQMLFHLQANLGLLAVNFADMKKYPPFSDAALRNELLHRFNQVPGVNIPADKIDRDTWIKIEPVVANHGLEKLMEVLDWAIQQVIDSRAT
jgi:hypothetical protein